MNKFCTYSGTAIAEAKKENGLLMLVSQYLTGIQLIKESFTGEQGRRRLLEGLVGGGRVQRRLFAIRHRREVRAEGNQLQNGEQRKGIRYWLNVSKMFHRPMG